MSNSFTVVGRIFLTNVTQCLAGQATCSGEIGICVMDIGDTYICCPEYLEICHHSFILIILSINNIVILAKGEMIVFGNFNG